jgi:hypothetical protein
VWTPKPTASIAVHAIEIVDRASHAKQESVFWFVLKDSKFAAAIAVPLDRSVAWVTCARTRTPARISAVVAPQTKERIALPNVSSANQVHANCSVLRGSRPVGASVVELGKRVARGMYVPTPTPTLRCVVAPHPAQVQIVRPMEKPAPVDPAPRIALV